MGKLRKTRRRRKESEGVLSFSDLDRIVGEVEQKHEQRRPLKLTAPSRRVAASARADLPSSQKILDRIRDLKQSLTNVGEIEDKLERRWSRKVAQLEDELQELEEWREKIPLVVGKLKELSAENQELAEELELAQEREERLARENERLKQAVRQLRTCLAEIRESLG